MPEVAEKVDEQMVDTSLDEQFRRDCMMIDAAYWADNNDIILPNSVIFSFDDRPYLIEPMSSRDSVICCMKATSGGFSISVGILPTLHGMIHGRYPQGVGHYFPTDKDMQDYVKAVFNPLIQNNKGTIGKYVKSGGKGTDTASLKRIGGSNLFLRGATLTPADDGVGAKKSVKVSGIQFDRLVPDESDQMDDEVFAKMIGRMANACVDGIPGKSEIRYIANPSDEDRGIDLFWQKSDQREWFRLCTCGAWTCAELEFMNDPEKCVGIYPELLPDGTQRGYIRCVKCGKPVGIALKESGKIGGEWVTQKPSNAGMTGYHWSHLTSNYQNPARILRDFRNPPEGNLGDVYRLDLGYAYSSLEDKLSKNTVLACCGHDGIPDHHSGPCAIGIDNDDGKHLVIITKIGNDRYELIKPMRVDDFNGAYDLIRRFNIKSGVVDIRPNKDSAVQFQKAARQAGCRVFLCEYTDSPLQDALFNENTGVVKVFRTGIFDMSHRVIANQQILLPRQCAAIEEFAVQCCKCVKQKDTKIKDKIVYRYVKTGDQKDHYRNALNYALIATFGYRIATIRKGGNINKQKYAVHTTTQI